MHWKDALKKRGILISVLMVVLGIYMSISAKIESRGLEKEHPFVQYSVAEIEQMKIEKATGERTDLPNLDENLSSDERLTLRIRYGRSKMSFWAGIVLIVLGAVLTVVFYLKEARLAAILDEHEKELNTKEQQK